MGLGGIVSGIGDFFLGEDPSLETEQLDTMSPEQQDLLNNFLIPFLKGTPIDEIKGIPFEGKRTADLTPNELMLQELLGGTNFDAPGPDPLFDDITQALTPLLSGDVGDFEEFFQETIAKPGIEQFYEDTLPGISKAFGPTDFFGSDRFSAVSQAGEDLTDSLTAGRADVGFQTRESALDRSILAGELLAGIPGQQSGVTRDFYAGLSDRMGALRTGQEVAQIPRGVAQAGLDADFEEFLRVNTQERDNRIDQILQALGLSTVENVGVGLPGSPGAINSFLGSAGSGAAIAKMF